MEDHAPLLGGVAVELLVQDHLVPGQIREVVPEVLAGILLPKYVLENFVLSGYLRLGKLYTV